MRILFSEALELGSIVMSHGRGGGEAGYACALEAALIAIGREPFVLTTRGQSLLGRSLPPSLMTNYADVVAEWPYLWRTIPLPGILRRMYSIEGEEVSTDIVIRLCTAVFYANDTGQPRGVIVDLVRDYENKWGIRPTPELPAPQRTADKEGDAICAFYLAKR